MEQKSRSEFFNTHKEGAASGFPIDQKVLSEKSKDYLQNPRERIISNSGPLAPPVSWTSSVKKNDDISIASTRSGLECRDSLSSVSQHVEATNQVGRFSQSYVEPARKHDRRRQSLIPGTHQPDYARINSKDSILVRKHSTWITHTLAALLSS